MKIYARILFITAALILAACESTPSRYVECRTSYIRRLKDLLEMRVI